EENDVFGDVVNVAARVEAQAVPNQILISRAVYEKLPAEIPCVALGATPVKGKSAPIEVYEVLWDERQVARGLVMRGAQAGPQPEKICVLEVSWEAERVKLSFDEHWPGEEKPVKHYEYLPVALATVQQDVDAIVALLNQATDHRGTLE